MDGETSRTVRHRISTRVWHWMNVLSLAVMLMSGLMIFNAHPHLYWGGHGAQPDMPWFEIVSLQARGEVHVAGLSIDTTGFLGRWTDHTGVVRSRAFPEWVTLPSGYNLALARDWHLTFAWLFMSGLVAYLGRSLWNGHLRRDLLPSLAEASPAHLGRDILDHLRLRFPKGEAASRYNVLQKLAYLSVLVGLLPGMVLSGLAMSPAVLAGWPWLLVLFQGHASARSVHFISAALIVGFVLVHLAMVVLSGPIHGIRSMITGGRVGKGA
ncbi:cytochrome b/b6 domain-containing protein [Paragemmobacter straminiformis]|uniref:Cytochrome b/b6 domain-containing protein n=1 Tax=Paragemmobacter straminiformis TaxID=2045119 RepID=A0A842IDJ8_9RHOB|nr:cytochrome b/b6 domain-containing protein [Gemmobacter straminiformis]MBC2837641.1 cytochrome b/b6 domain-containing protein [Gemmobacter straminiformis]